VGKCFPNRQDFSEVFFLVRFERRLSKNPFGYYRISIPKEAVCALGVDGGDKLDIDLVEFDDGNPALVITKGD